MTEKRERKRERARQDAEKVRKHKERKAQKDKGGSRRWGKSNRDD